MSDRIERMIDVRASGCKSPTQPDRCCVQIQIDGLLDPAEANALSEHLRTVIGPGIAEFFVAWLESKEKQKS